jgi:hypothetical protein
MKTPMTFKQVLDQYKSILANNPGKALVIGNGHFAVLENGYLFGTSTMLNGEPSIVDSYDFDSSAFISDEARWDDDTSENLINQIENPTFVVLKTEN